ncbi:MAG: hypothetical protein JWL80_505 [Parcubacteria group bacterium]|nr:hypothetical protein [Parcubacteria group bacterium]
MGQCPGGACRLGGLALLPLLLLHNLTPGCATGTDLRPGATTLTPMNRSSVQRNLVGLGGWLVANPRNQLTVRFADLVVQIIGIFPHETDNPGLSDFRLRSGLCGSERCENPEDVHVGDHFDARTDKRNRHLEGLLVLETSLRNHRGHGLCRDDLARLLDPRLLLLRWRSRENRNWSLDRGGLGCGLLDRGQLVHVDSDELEVRRVDDPEPLDSATPLSLHRLERRVVIQDEHEIHSILLLFHLELGTTL